MPPRHRPRRRRRRPRKRLPRMHTDECAGLVEITDNTEASKEHGVLVPSQSAALGKNGGSPTRGFSW